MSDLVFIAYIISIILILELGKTKGWKTFKFITYYIVVTVLAVLSLFLTNNL